VKDEGALDALEEAWRTHTVLTDLHHSLLDQSAATRWWCWWGEQGDVVEGVVPKPQVESVLHLLNELHQLRPGGCWLALLDAAIAADMALGVLPQEPLVRNKVLG